MSKKPLSLSIVIPVYNEQRYLASCLDAIARQDIKPDEVIVVDNNSTDKTVEIAESYKFVTVMHEKRQHQAFAQKTGFDKAVGDIIGRIDADVILPQEWVKNVKKHFKNIPELVALTGEPDPYDIYLKKTGIFIFDFYNQIATEIAGVRLLWGANCAIKRSAWLQISDEVLQRPDIWEDFDLSFCLKDLGKIKLFKDIKVRTSFRAVHATFTNQISYHIRSFRVFYLRTNILKTSLFVLSRLTIVLVGIIVLVDLCVLQPILRRRGHYFGAPKK
jgi:glycosyltransferase involved in cell wall biosynthesis